jgi:hypothetical protein
MPLTISRRSIIAGTSASGSHSTRSDSFCSTVSPQGHASYKRGSATVETVIGHLKDQTGLRRFSSRRGLTAAASELNLAAAVVILLKLRNHTLQPAN